MTNEYLIKWRGKSYLHCTWETIDSLVEMELASLGLGWEGGAGDDLGPTGGAIRSRINTRISKFITKFNKDRRSAAVAASFAGASRFDADVDVELGGTAAARNKALKLALGDDAAAAFAAAAVRVGPVGDADEPVADDAGERARVA